MLYWPRFFLTSSNSGFILLFLSLSLTSPPYPFIREGNLHGKGTGGV
jgi:hypothetical protein